MSLTDSDRIITLGNKAGFPIELDEDGNLVSPTEIWVYTTTSNVPDEIHIEALTSRDSASSYMNRIDNASAWIIGFDMDPNLIDSADVWTEITE